MQAADSSQNFFVAVLQITASAVAAVNAHMFYPRVPKPGDVVVQVPSPAPSHAKRGSGHAYRPPWPWGSRSGGLIALVDPVCCCRHG